MNPEKKDIRTGGTRTERDSMGEIEIPATALYGASTQRAVLNFPISGTRLPRPFIHAYGLPACLLESISLLGNVVSIFCTR